MNRLIYSTEEDKYFDYCLYSYEPLTDPKGKIKSINLLNQVLEYLNYEKKIFDIIFRIQENIGKDKTVFGIKKKGNEIKFEFYFYNYKKADILVTMTSLKKVFEQYLAVKSEPNEQVPYFMFSIDIDKEIISKKKSDGFHVYLPLTEKRSGGYSYLLKSKQYTLENHYEFFDVTTEKREILRKIKDSVFVDNKTDVKQILIPELINCKTICITKKKNCDCIYFSRINIDQFLFFLQRFEYPKHIVDFINKNKNKLDHLLYDVGFDYFRKDSKIIIEKSGFYGYL